MKKRIFSLLFVITVLSLSIALFSGCNKVENKIEEFKETINERSGDGLDYYLLDDETYGIKAGGTIYLSSVRIPSKYKFKEVSTILPNAFENCNNLKEIKIPSTVKSIGSYAFAGCTNLTSVMIPSSVRTIDESAFIGCTNITVFCEAESAPSGWATQWNNSGNSVVWGCSGEIGATDSGFKWYRNNSGMVICGYSGKQTSVIIPETINGTTVVEISDYAFKENKTLTSVAIPGTIKKIGNSAFFGCQSLTSIILTEGITSISQFAFSNCTELKNIIIPKSVANIGGYAFQGCKKLTIYCEAYSSSNGWDYYWNWSKCPVVWGYAGK